MVHIENTFDLVGYDPIPLNEDGDDTNYDETGIHFADVHEDETVAGQGSHGSKGKRARGKDRVIDNLEKKIKTHVINLSPPSQPNKTI